MTFKVQTKLLVLQTSWLHHASIIFNTLISNWCTQR